MYVWIKLMGVISENVQLLISMFVGEIVVLWDLVLGNVGVLMREKFWCWEIETHSGHKQRKKRHIS